MPDRCGPAEIKAGHAILAALGLISQNRTPYPRRVVLYRTPLAQFRTHRMLRKLKIISSRR